VNEVIDVATRGGGLKKNTGNGKVSVKNVHPIELVNLIAEDPLLAEAKYE
jgi:hypothetical protein